MTTTQALLELANLGAHLHERPGLILGVCADDPATVTADLIAALDADRLHILQMLRGHRFMIQPWIVWRPARGS